MKQRLWPDLPLYALMNFRAPSPLSAELGMRSMWVEALKRERLDAREQKEI
jgi:hypothetical protein